MRLAALTVSLLLLATPVQAGPRAAGPTRAAAVHQPSHHVQPGMAGVAIGRPRYYSSNDRYSGGRAVYAAYSNAGYGPYGGRRGYGGFGGGFGGAYNIEMQRLLEHQFELRAIGQYLPINPVALDVSYNPNFVRRASLLDPDATDHPAPQPLSVANPFYRPALVRQVDETSHGQVDEPR